MSEKNEALLSSDELSAIQDMVSSGEFDQEPFNVELDAELYNISRNEETLGVSYGALTQINERFHRFFRTRLLTELDYNPRLSVATPQLMKYSDYITTVASPASINVVELEPPAAIFNPVSKKPKTLGLAVPIPTLPPLAIVNLSAPPCTILYLEPLK